MPEIIYLRYLLEKYHISDEIKELSEKLLNLYEYEELLNFAKEIGMENVEAIPKEHLKDKIAYEIIERHFLEKKQQRD